MLMVDASDPTQPDASRIRRSQTLGDDMNRHTRSARHPLSLRLTPLALSLFAALPVWRSRRVTAGSSRR